jgi:hypothetical protein
MEHIERVSFNAAPSAAALSTCRKLLFDAMREIFDLTASYAVSGAEAAFRGDELTIGVHIKQIRSCLIEVIRLRNDLAAQGGKAVAA